MRFLTHPDRMTSINNARLPCCVRGDPWTIDSPDYVTVTLNEPDDGMTQWLGAHATCLRRAFAVQVEIGKGDRGSKPDR